MAIPKFEADLRVISKLGDNPGTDNGYTTQEFKEAFDKAPLLIQKFINEVLIPAANASSSPEEGLSMKGPINMNGQAIKGLNAPTADDEAVNWGSVKALGKAKAGFIYPLASAVVPDGFLLCDGAAYARAEYPELFAAIGTMYGSGDGATTFNVPDLRNRVPAGSSENHPAGERVGEETHQLTADEVPRHTHTARTCGNTFTASMGTQVDAAWYASTTYNTGEAGGDQPHNNMQPTTYIHGYIIATGKGTAVSIADIILGAQAIPLGLEYGGVGATDPKTARENLEITPENIGALSMELLWENASPNSEFAAQTIACASAGDISKYRLLFVISTGIASSTFVVNDVGYSARISSVNAEYDISLTRDFTIDSGSITFTDCKKRMGNETNTSNAGHCPLYIYGIK